MIKFKKYLINIFIILSLSISADARAPVVFKRLAVEPGNLSKVVSATHADTADASSVLNPPKVSDTAGLWRVYSSANTNGFGVLGPDTATTNVYLKPTEELPAAEDNYIKLGTATTQLVDGISSTVIPFTYEVIPVGGSGSISVNGSVVNDPNLVSTSDIIISNNAGSVSCVVNQIALSKIAAASITTAAEIDAEGDTVLDDNTVLTAGATYSLISQILGLPNLTIISPTNNAWITSNTASFTGTASDAKSISLIEWKLEAGGTYANATGTTSWSQNGPWGSDGTNKTAYFRATDNEGNSIVKSVRFNLDTTDPVVVSAADSTHDGITPFTGTLVATETNISTVTFTTTNASPVSGTCTGTYPNYTTPSITPSGTGNVTITYTATDLSGRTGTDTQLFIYSGAASYNIVFFDNFNRVDNTNIVTGSSWSSEVDTSNILSITSNELVCLSSLGTDARAVKTLSTNNTDWQIEFKFKINDVTAVHSGVANTYFLNLYCSAGLYALISLRTDVSGNVNQIVIGRYNDAGSVSYQYINYAFAVNTYYTMTIQSDIGTPATADGVFTVKVNSTDIYTVSNLAEETRPIITEMRFGINTYGWSQAVTWTYDDFSFGYK